MWEYLLEAASAGSEGEVDVAEARPSSSAAALGNTAELPAACAYDILRSCIPDFRVGALVGEGVDIKK